MLSLGSRVILLFFCSASFNFAFVRGQCTVPPGILNTHGFPSPNTFFSKTGEFQMFVEVNDRINRKSMYAMQYFDGTYGRVDTGILGKRTTFLYDLDSITGETFIFDGESTNCQSSLVSSNPQPPFMNFSVIDWQYDGPYKRFYGPLAMFFYAFMDNDKMGFENAAVIRGLDANSWMRCSADGKLEYHYYLLNEKKSLEIFGINDDPFPLRVTVKGKNAEGKDVDQVYEIMFFDLTLPNHDLFNLPPTKGCQRYFEQDVVEITQRSKDYDLEAEIVFTPYKGTDKYSFISDLDVISSKTRNFYMYRTYHRPVVSEDKKPGPAQATTTLFDSKHGYLYEMDDITGACTVKRQSVEEFKPIIQLPDGQNLSLYEDSMLEITERTKEGFHYLGEDIQRGRKVFVFEKKGPPINPYISTQYYLADDETQFEEFEEKNIPVKIIYDSKGILNMFKGVIMFNIYGYSSHLRKYPDITPCYKKDTQWEWFQIIFPTGTEMDSQLLLSHLSVFKDNYFQALIQTEIVTPFHIPEIMVDFDADYIYVTTKLLNRPAYKHDFTLHGNYILLDPHKMRLLPQEDCFEACLEEDRCKAISLCGANCALSYVDFSEDVTQKDDGCQFYNRSSEISQMTTSQVYDALNDLVSNQGFTIPVFYGSKTAEFTATEIKTGIEVGGAKKPKGPDNLSGHFTVFRQMQKLKSHDPGLRMTYEECQQSCINDPKCGTFSYCLVASTCMTSEYHSTALIKNLLMLEDSQCMILERQFEDYFNLFRDMIVVTTAAAVDMTETSNECAKRCIQETGFHCRSFDYCLNENGDNCYLHTTHIEQGKGKNVQQASRCFHFSRNFIYDFEELKKDQMFYMHKSESRVYDVTLDECATFCGQDPECQTFDYCKRDKDPKLICTTTNSSARDWTMQFKKADSCSVYAKIVDKDTSMNILLQKAEPKVSSGVYLTGENIRHVQVIDDTGYSKSLTGGISFFMFLIGIAIGVGATFGYGYYRANRRVA